MLVIPGQRGIDNCDGSISRRELLRVGGSGFIGLTLASAGMLSIWGPFWRPPTRACEFGSMTPA